MKLVAYLVEWRRDLKKVSELTLAGERFGDGFEDVLGKQRLSSSPSDFVAGLPDNIYCSKKLYDYISEISNRLGIHTLYISELDPSRNKTIPIDIFSNYIKKKNIYCLRIDSFNGDKFLEPKATIQEYYGFFKRDFWGNLIKFEYLMTIAGIGFLALMFAIIAIVYHKIVLYIIYGNAKK